MPIPTIHEYSTTKQSVYLPTYLYNDQKQKLLCPYNDFHDHNDVLRMMPNFLFFSMA